MQAPPPGTDAQLLPTGVARARRRRRRAPHVRRRRTRTASSPGIDVAPTVARAPRRRRPGAVKGQPMTAEPGRDAAALRIARRAPAGRAAAPPARAVDAASAAGSRCCSRAMLVADRRGAALGVARRAARGALAAVGRCCSPPRSRRRAPPSCCSSTGLALARRGADRPARRLAARARSSRRSSALAAYAVDLASGSPLIIRSLLGPNPLFGARFYGIGNELEATLAALLLVGVGAAARRPRPLARRASRRSRAAAWRSRSSSARGASGADVGGVITIGAGAARRGGAHAPGRADAPRPRRSSSSRRSLGLGAARGGRPRDRRRLALHAHGAARRRVRRPARHRVPPLRAGGAAGDPRLHARGDDHRAPRASRSAIRRRERVLAPVDGDPAWRALLAGLVAAGVAGALFNDSGPVLLLFEAFFAAKCVSLYLRGDPRLARDALPAPLASRRDAHRPGLPLFVDVPGGRDAAYRGPGRAAARRGASCPRPGALRPAGPPQRAAASRCPPAGARRCRSTSSRWGARPGSRPTARSRTSPLTPSGVQTLRRELEAGDFDVVNIHEPVAPAASWDALGFGDAALVGTFHTYGTNAVTHGIARAMGAGRRMRNLHGRIAVSEAAAWTARRFFGGRYDDRPQRRRRARRSAPRASRPVAAAACGSRSSARPSSARACPVLLRAFEGLREHVDAELTIVGAVPEEVEPLLLDARGVTVLGPRRRRGEVARRCARRTCSARRRSAARASAWSSRRRSPRARRSSRATSPGTATS